VDVDPGITGYAREYFNNTYYRDAATPVSVLAGGEVPGINIGLGVGGPFRAGDSRRNRAGIYNIPVEVFDFSTGAWMWAVNTQSDGAYTIYGLRKELIGWILTLLDHLR